MITAIVLGAGFGLGLLAIGRGLVPRRLSLAAILAALDRPVPSETPRDEAAGWMARLGRPLVPALAALGLPTAGVRRDLLVVDGSPQPLLAEKAVAALAGVLVAPAAAVVMSVGGVGVPWLFPAWASLAVGAAGFMVPDVAVRSQAAKRRTEFRHSLSVFLDLVVVSLAAGVGIEAALTYAGQIGSGWAFDRIGAALQAARIARRPPWQSLGELGEQLGIGELAELAASVSLAGTEGAKIRASLAAKASGLRAHQLSDAEAQASAATERLSLPIVLLFAGFLILLGYPAVAHVFADF